MLTFDDLKRDEEVSTLLALSETQLDFLGYTEHSTRHLGIVSERAESILKAIGADKRECELGKIAAYLHDIGNIVNRAGHAQSGAILAYNLLTARGMSYNEAAQIIIAIGNHDEGEGYPVSRISAAVILSDKSDVHRERVRKGLDGTIQGRLGVGDIHDRVNYAVEKSDVIISSKDKTVSLMFEIDTKICSVMDYFEIFLERMKLCKKATEYLGYSLRLIINGTNLA
ncbi:MAG: phosphohydrolase [Clostridia bacterium]